MRSTIPKVEYHSAHKPPVQAPEVQRYGNLGCIAFTHDLTSSLTLPPEYSFCDVLVADLPWQKGFNTFNERAGLTDRTYENFMASVSGIVRLETRPTWLITGKHALAYLPVPDVVLPMRLNEWDAVGIGYNPGPEGHRGYDSSQEFLQELVKWYERAGDFCCGYGRTGRFFMRAGKGAVLSDVNPSCIGYISQQHGWLARG